jgi:hypothetical protein
VRNRRLAAKGALVTPCPPASRLLGKDLFPFAALVAVLPVVALRLAVDHSAAAIVGAPACTLAMVASWEFLCRLAGPPRPR